MKSNYYNKKCKGCGQYFSDDINSPSYVVNPKENTLYCKRCFQIKHYKKIDNKNVNDEQINEVINNINIDNGNLIILVVDLFDIKNSLISNFKDYENKIIVVNKLSVLPKKFNANLTLLKIKNIIDSFGVVYKDIIMYDAISNIGIKRIFKYIENTTKNRKQTYVLGKTNTGKSSLINAILKLNKENQYLTVSPLKNTTLNLSKIKINKHTIIDTPGIPNNQSLINKLDDKDIFLFNNSNKYVSKNFKINKNNQTYFIEGLAYINVSDIYEFGNLTFYIKSNIKIHHTNKSKIKDLIKNRNKVFKINYNQKVNFKEINFEAKPDTKYNLFLNGLCLVSFKNLKSIQIGVVDDVEIFISEEAII